MSAALASPARPLAGAGGHGGLPRPRRLTLEQRLEEAWAGLRASGSADCPVCHAPMRLAPDGAGDCTGCGSRLS